MAFGCFTLSPIVPGGQPAFATGGVISGNTGQTTTQIELFPRAKISSLKDGAVFYGAYAQELAGYVFYADRSPVPAGRLPWLKTVGGATSVIDWGNPVHAAFTFGEHKLILQALTESNHVAASATITVTFYESIR